MRWYQDALEETYDLQLLCNFHGCVKPSGLRRTWPHELTREAVRGHEFHISRYDRVMPMNQEAIKPFTRLLGRPGRLYTDGVRTVRIARLYMAARTGAGDCLYLAADAFCR